MKYPTLIFIVAITLTLAPTQNVFANTQSEETLNNQELIVSLMHKIAVLQSTLAAKQGDQTTEAKTSRLWGVVGPKTLRAGESGIWNQDNYNRPVKYTYFNVDNLRWTWGDGSLASNKNVHAYKRPGLYKAKLEGLNFNGTVTDTVNFTVKVTAAKKYTLKITELDTVKNYKLGSEIPLTYTVKNAPGIDIGAWVGFRLISEKTGDEFFLTDAWDVGGGSGSIKLPGSNDYSQDEPLLPGEYRLEMYMYGADNTSFPSVKSRPFTILSE